MRRRGHEEGGRTSKLRITFAWASMSSGLDCEGCDMSVTRRTNRKKEERQARTDAFLVDLGKVLGLHLRDLSLLLPATSASENKVGIGQYLAAALGGRGTED